MRVCVLLFFFVLVSSRASAQAPESSLATPIAQGLTVTAEPTVWASPGPRLQLEPHGYERRRLLNARPSLFLPITTIATGVVVAVAPWAALLDGYIFSGFTGGGESDSHLRDVYQPFLICAVVGAALATGGAFWLRSSLQKRLHYNRQIKRLDLAQGPALLRW